MARVEYDNKISKNSKPCVPINVCVTFVSWYCAVLIVVKLAKFAKKKQMNVNNSKPSISNQTFKNYVNAFYTQNKYYNGTCVFTFIMRVIKHLVDNVHYISAFFRF
eukprot:413586_1